MNKFSDFAKEEAGLEGDKVTISELFNKKIIAVAYRKLKSRAVQGKTCVEIQFKLNDELRVTFTNSAVLERQLDQFKEMLPFEASIKKIHNYYTFT